jgi:hypothetical protein
MMLLDTVRNAFSGVRAYGTLMANRAAGNPTILVNPAREHALHEHMRFYAGISTLRTSPFHYNYTEETREMRHAYRKWSAEPVIKSALLGKVYSVASLDLHVNPVVKSNPREQEKADCLRHALRRNDTGFSGLLAELLLPALMDGWSLCEPVLDEEIRGRFRGKVVISQFKSKDTRFITPVIDAYRNVVGYYNAMGNYGHRFDPDDFVAYSHLPMFRNPTGTSDLRAAYRAMTMIPAVLRLRMIFLDKYIGPFLKATISNKALKEKMAGELENARADGFIVLEQGATIEVIDLATRGTADFQAGLDDLRKEAATAISGAFLHMMTAADPNARGDSEVQKGTTDLFVWMLAEQATAILNHKIGPKIIGLNYGFDEDVPQCTLEAVRPSDITADLAIDESLDRMGVDTSLEELLDRARRSPPKNPQTDSVQGAKVSRQQAVGGFNPANPNPMNPTAPAIGFAEPPAGHELILLPTGQLAAILTNLSAERLADPTIADLIEVQAYDSFAESSKFTGKKKDSRGREYCYNNGVRVPCPKDTGPAPKPEPGPKPPTPEPKPTDKPKPTEPAVDYNHRDPAHPIAKAIQADEPTRQLVADFHEQFVKKRIAKEELEDRLTAVFADMNPLVDKIMALGDPDTPEKQATYSKLHDQLDKIKAEKFDPLRDRTEKAREESRQASQDSRKWLAENIRPTQKSTVDYTVDPSFTSKVGDKADAAIRDGVSFANSVTSGVTAPVEVKRCEIDRNGYYQKVFVAGKGFQPTIALHPDLLAGAESRGEDMASVSETMAHETGHHIEETKPGLMRKAHEFLDYRCGKEPFVSLNSVAGGGYSPYEAGRKDSFDKVFAGAHAYYVGKRYGDGVQFPTEVISMGLEMLYKDPIHFARNDPEYFHWLISALKG